MHLKNTTGKEVFAVVQIRYEGGSYNPDKIKLAPYQTVAVDIRKLRDAQERDIRGGVMPPDVMGGQVLWYEQAPESLIGRAEIFAVAEGLSSSFSCGGAGTCGQSFKTAAMSPTSATKDAGNSGTFFTPTETDTDCFNAQLGPFTVTAPLTWSSTNPSVASVSSSGFVTCVGPGTTTILASWSTTVYACGNNCQSNPANPSAAGTLQVKPSVTSLTVSQPSTKNPVTGVAPADGTVTVTNTTVGFASATSSDLVAYFMSTDVQTTITATGVNPSSAASQLKWQVDRDTTDSVATGTPTLQPMGGTAKITPDKPGNFRLVCYYDSNSSGTYNSGEELRVFRFAVVRATAQSGHFIRSTVSFSGGSSSVGTMNAMSLQLDILLEGGGSNRTIGTGKVVLGEVGNLSTDNFVVNYPVPIPTPPAPGNVSGTENENPGGATSMVDTVNVTMGNQPTGGNTPFRGNSMDTNLGSGSGGNGQLRRVTSLDDPGFGWDANHPTTLNLWGTTVNGNAFKEFVVGYSTSFPRNYVVFAVGNWTVSANGSRSGGIWTNSSSSVSIPGGTLTGTTLSAPLTITITSGTPQSGDASGIQVLGLSFVREFRMDHTP